ncbi:MAG: serine hydrolase domain-containing protein [Bacteroidota bacterium]
MMNKTGLLLLLILSFLTGNAQTKDASLDSLFTRLHREGNWNGNVLIAQNGKILYRKSFGYADFAKKTPNTDASRFQTASTSKVFTSTAVLQLVEQGKVKLNEPFVRYFPEFPFPGITLRHLLSHTSGLPDLELYEPMVRKYPDTLVTNAVTIAALRDWKKPLHFKPGEQWEYCNVNYHLLALLVEKVSKMPFGAYLKQYIFRPAGMMQTYLKEPLHPMADKSLVTNHLLPTMYHTVPVNAETVQLKDLVMQWKFRFEQYSIMGPVGSANVITTTEDLLKFDQALYTSKLLSQPTLALAFTPTQLNNGETYYGEMEIDYGGKTSYGLGWVVRQDAKRGTIVGHDGYTGSMATTFYRNLTQKQTVIMFDNTVGSHYREKVASAINILNGELPLPIPIKKSAVRLFGEALLQKGPEKALVCLNTWRSDTTRYYFTEREMNVLGYEFLFNGYSAQSLETFKINTLLFPTSFNVYDSYGDAFAQIGRKEEAILMFQRAIALNPESEGSKQSLKKLLEK